MACGVAGINRDTFYSWTTRGRSQNQGIYRAFVYAAEQARASAKLLAVRTIRLAMVGGWFEAPVYDEDGNPIPLVDPATGEQQRDENDRPKFMMRHQYKEPSQSAAKWYLEHTDEDFGGGVKGTAVKRNDEPPAVGEDRQRTFDIDTNSLASALGQLFSLGVRIPGWDVKPALPAPGNEVDGQGGNLKSKDPT